MTSCRSFLASWLLMLPLNVWLNMHVIIYQSFVLAISDLFVSLFVNLFKLISAIREHGASFHPSPELLIARTSLEQEVSFK